MALMNFIQRTINTRVTALAYLFCAWQFNFGLNQFVQDRKGGSTTVLSQIEALIPSEWWGLGLVIASIALVVGMLLKRVRTVQVSSFAGFSLWIMAAISYGLNGYVWLHVPGAILLTLMFGYFFLSAGLDQLWDYTPERY